MTFDPLKLEDDFGDQLSCGSIYILPILTQKN
jgi:hypothetical protein